MWRCPNCGTPQAETARCWVCHRSSTTCSTCRHFRTSLSADVGWCALDPRRRPLSGLEQRGCWQARSAAELAPGDGGAGASRRPPTAGAGDASDPWPPHLEFIPVELIGAVGMSDGPATAHGEPVDGPASPLPTIARDRDDGWADRTSLFGEPEG